MFVNGSSFTLVHQQGRAVNKFVLTLSVSLMAEMHSDRDVTPEPAVRPPTVLHVITLQLNRLSTMDLLKLQLGIRFASAKLRTHLIVKRTQDVTVRSTNLSCDLNAGCQCRGQHELRANFERTRVG